MRGDRRDYLLGYSVHRFGDFSVKGVLEDSNGCFAYFFNKQKANTFKRLDM